MTLIRPRPRPDFAAARRAMIDSQLRTSGVNTPYALNRMSAVAREDFVPENLRAFAYVDRAVPLANGRQLPPPLFHGRLLEEAEPRATDEVLLVDPGSGYVAELLRPLVARIDTISPGDALVAQQRKGGYDLLVIDGAIEQLPDALAAQLGDEGRVVTGLVRNGLTRLAIGRKTAGEVALLPLAEIGVPRLPEFDAPKEWSF